MKVTKRQALLSMLVAAILSGGGLAQVAPQSPITMKNAAGTVTFNHPSHLKVAGNCIVCHHASKAEKPLKSAQEACTGCHTKPATPPVSTGLESAFHNSGATNGLCIDCHRKQNDAGKAAPTKCEECHQQATGDQ